MPNADISYLCSNCNKSHSVKKKGLVSILPNKLIAGTFINAYAPTPCGKFVELQFLRDDWDRGYTTDPLIISEAQYMKKLKISTGTKKSDKKEELLTYFRPLNKKDAIKYALDEKLIKGKHKTEDFNFNGRTGVFLYNNDSLVFISSSEQNDDSLEKIVSATENLSYQILEKRQNASKKKKKKPSNEINLYFMDSKKNNEAFQKKIDKRKKDYTSTKDDTPIPLRKINDNMLVAKKNIVSKIKRTPGMIARTALFTYLPIIGIGYAGYKGVKFIKTLISLKSNGITISNGINDVNEDINGRNLETYNTQKSALETNITTAETTMNTEFADIRPGSAGAANLSELDRYMLSNGAQLLDNDGDGFTDAYYLPSSGVTTSDPFSDGTIKPEHMLSSDYDRLNGSWTDLQEYETARLNFSNLTEDLDSLINGDGDLTNLNSTLDKLIDNQDTNNLSVDNVVDDLLRVGGWILGLTGTIALSIYINNYIKKTKNGSSLRPLKNDELKSLYRNKLDLDSSKFLNDVKYDTKVLDSLIANKTKFQKDIKTNKQKLEKILKEPEIKESQLEEINNELEMYKAHAPYYSKAYNYLNNLYLTSSPSSIFDLDKLIKNDLIDALNIDYSNKVLIDSSITKEFLEENLPHIVIWNDLTNKSIKLQNKFLKQQRKPKISSKINKLTVLLERNEKKIEKEKEKLKTITNSMFDHLIADPELIHTKNYEKFGNEHNLDFVSVVTSNKTDLDSARKALKKIRKKIPVI
jgi:hypothetical protein